MPDVERIEYDEFGYFAENAEEFGLPYEGPPDVTRRFVAVDESREMSALVWGGGEPEVVLVHGGAQNAHTWDTVALALGRPLVAVDLPGHGHSDAPAMGAGEFRAEALAGDLAVLVEELAPKAAAIVGMSLGGLTAIAIADSRPDLVRRLVLVDITPGVDRNKSKEIMDFVRGPATFPSFDEILARTIEYNPTRSESSLRRGILHNAEQLEDGSWRWRYRRHDAPDSGTRPDPHLVSDNEIDTSARLWDAVGRLAVPVMLVRGMRPQSVVDDADEAELRRRLPDVRVEHFFEAGHSVQGDMPVELAVVIEDFAFGG
jgi:pimeloyl-ACP methyl ester carboxylesterase